jgi:hypothetical protein
MEPKASTVRNAIELLTSLRIVVDICCKGKIIYPIAQQFSHLMGQDHVTKLGRRVATVSLKGLNFIIQGNITTIINQKMAQLIPLF